MIFNSVTFIVFLILVVGLFWSLPGRARLWMLLIASCVFYGFWRWEYLSIMFISALTDYYTSLAIYNTPPENKRRRRNLLYITLVVNLGLLFYFKYLYFFTDNANTLLGTIGTAYRLPLVEILLPFGISFYTFETISYTVDVYRGLLKPEKSFLNYGLFVTFFPKLVAGPIQRAAELMPQLKTRTYFKWEFLEWGIRRILYGLFLKVVLADNISPLVDEGFAMAPDSLSALDVWTLAFLFGLQIYFDFSAYSHIAVGAAKLMGIQIPENFNFPYIAASFKEFWKRWHISLSAWIRDYLYLPLSGVRVMKTTATGGIGESLEKQPSSFNKNRALFLTWAIMGLWHGARWTFVFWGVYHAIVIFLERQMKPVRDNFPVFNNRFFSWAITMPLAMLSWIPFRAVTLQDSFTMMSKVFIPSSYTFIGMRENIYLITAILFLLVTLNAFLYERTFKVFVKMPVIRSSYNVVKLAVLIILVYTFLRPISQFIYFQF
jgi:D-alanyl-lipoteichoic acid acyltransferase DltB (MBOAT superfamily)